jgi:hypothetical protein
VALPNYDPVRNRGHINTGLSHDTSQFAYDSLLWHWNRIGKQCYPDASSILLLCDCGGSNSANSKKAPVSLFGLQSTTCQSMRD